MKRLVLKPELEPHEEYPHDVDRIVEVCERNGYQIERNTARMAWQDYSGSVAAGWLILPDTDEELLEDILRHTDVIDSDAENDE